jgi:hypothetical protein
VLFKNQHMHKYTQQYSFCPSYMFRSSCSKDRNCTVMDTVCVCTYVDFVNKKREYTLLKETKSNAFIYLHICYFCFFICSFVNFLFVYVIKKFATVGLHIYLFIYVLIH